jgi:hypothetical protein
LHLARRRAVDGVRGDRAEGVDGEVDDTPADLLVRVERHLHRAVRNVAVGLQVPDRGHDLRDAGLVVGTEQRRAVGRDQLVPDMMLQLLRLVGTDRRARRPERDVAAVVAEALRLDVRAADLARRVHVCEERDSRGLVRHRRCERRRDVAMLVDRDVVEPEVP